MDFHTVACDGMGNNYHDPEFVALCDCPCHPKKIYTVAEIREEIRYGQRCRCGQTRWEGYKHGFCMNCAGHNPACEGVHCDRHRTQLMTFEYNGTKGCQVDA